MKLLALLLLVSCASKPDREIQSEMDRFAQEDLDTLIKELDHGKRRGTKRN